jgi:hypothetical protein
VGLPNAPAPFAVFRQGLFGRRLCSPQFQRDQPMPRLSVHLAVLLCSCGSLFEIVVL